MHHMRRFLSQPLFVFLVFAFDFAAVGGLVLRRSRRATVRGRLYYFSSGITFSDTNLFNLATAAPL
jgi:hypothetical protein